MPLLAKATGGTGSDTGNKNLVTFLVILDFISHLLDYSYALMPQGSALLNSWDVTLDDMQVCAADGSADLKISESEEEGSVFRDHTIFTRASDWFWILGTSLSTTLIFPTPS